MLRTILTPPGPPEGTCSGPVPELCPRCTDTLYIGFRGGQVEAAAKQRDAGPLTPATEAASETQGSARPLMAITQDCLLFVSAL